MFNNIELVLISSIVSCAGLFILTVVIQKIYEITHSNFNASIIPKIKKREAPIKFVPLNDKQLDEETKLMSLEEFNVPEPDEIIEDAVPMKDEDLFDMAFDINVTQTKVLKIKY